MILVSFVALPILSGIGTYMLPKRLKLHMAHWVQGLLVALSLYLQLGLGQTLVHLSAFLPPTGMTLQADTLSSVLILLTNVVFFLLIVFARQESYMNRRFLLLFLSLQGLLNGVFLSTDLFNAYLLMEVATIVASVLIMYKKDSLSIYDGMIYLVTNMVAMAFFLMGIGYIYKLFGVLHYDTITQLSSQYTVRELALPLAFLMTGVSLKAALLPLFSWLPKAHGTASAPSIVSAVLSAVFVKTGVYLFIRVEHLLHAADVLSELFLVIGILTAFAGVLLAMIQKDIKLVLAYSTVSQIGVIMIGLNAGSKIAVYGALHHLVSHGAYKSMMFLLAGVLIQIYESRNIDHMRGLFRLHRPLGVLLFIGILAVTGAPFTGGGYGKLLIGGVLEARGLKWVFDVFTLLSAVYVMKLFPILVDFTPNHAVDKWTSTTVSRRQVMVLSTFALFAIGFGVFGNGVQARLLNTFTSVTLWDQAGKAGLYILLTGVGGLLYHIVNRPRSPLHRLRTVDLSFNSMSLSILGFFVVVLVYVTRVGG